MQKASISSCLDIVATCTCMWLERAMVAKTHGLASPTKKEESGCTSVPQDCQVPGKLIN